MIPADTLARQKMLTLLLWLLALALFGWTLRQLPLSDIARQIGLLAWRDWLLWSLINALILYVAVRRWQLLGQALQLPLTLLSLFTLRQAGSAVSFLTPGPHFGGEPLQLYWLCRNHGAPLHRAVAMLGLDRFMETVTNIAVLLAGVLVLLGTAVVRFEDWFPMTALLAGVLCGLPIVVAVVLRHPGWLAARLSPLLRGVNARVSAVGGRLRPEGSRDGSRERFGRGWQSLTELLKNVVIQHKPTLWLALLLSLAGWGALLLELALLLDFLGLDVSPTDIALIMVGMRLAMLLPAPGGIGTIEASLLWSFQILGLPGDAAVGMIALTRLRDALVLLAGVACLYACRRPGRRGEPALAE